MAKYCAFCKRKVGLLEGCTYLPGTVEFLACTDCYTLYSDVRSSIDNNPENFQSSIDKFKAVVADYKEVSPLFDRLFESFNKKYPNEYESPIQSTTTVTQSKNEIGPFEGDLVFTINGARGRHLDVYRDKCVFTTNVTVGSILAHNATDGEKTVYYVDCIGVQVKKPKLTLGYLQLETSSATMNNIANNFFSENTFTYENDTISEEKMDEVVAFIKKRIEEIKLGKTTQNSAPAAPQISVADDLLKWKQLLDMGAVTQEEFDEYKRKLLGK